MTLRIDGDILGDKALERALAQLPKANSKSVLRRAITKAAEPTRAMAERDAPRDTGDLAESIQVTTRLARSQRPNRGGAVRVFIGAESRNTFYAHLVEFGTRHSRAQPFLRPAWERTRREVLTEAGRLIWVNLAKTARTLARKAERGTLSRRAERALR